MHFGFPFHCLFSYLNISGVIFLVYVYSFIISMTSPGDIGSVTRETDDHNDLDHNNDTPTGTNNDTIQSRRSLLAGVCDRYNDSQAPEFNILHATPGGPGVETVLLPGEPPVTVCIPHKVGSHAWGVFSRKLAEIYPQRIQFLQSVNWKKRAEMTKKVVVVRHPLDRLVSAYRMIFQVGQWTIELACHFSFSFSCTGLVR